MTKRIAEQTVEHEGDSDTKCKWYTLNSPQKSEK